ncbi:MAG: 8-oxoguanine DNA glycosylase [Lachnospiraceae bacterium]|nr:8-oxoguanine DNA glycosylase [Lachnospiraceae bacterium]
MKKYIDHFNLKMIAKSGQCFRFKCISESPLTYEVVHRGHYVKITELSADKSGSVLDFSCDEVTFDEVFSDFLDLGTDYNYVEKAIYDFNDSHLIECYKKGYGIRILKQDLWEMIVSFLISQNNNIKRISNSIEAICKKADLPSIENPDAKRFPRPGEIDSSLFDDPSLGLGYRVPYLKEIYEYARKNPDWLNMLSGMSYTDAYENLLSHLGIGPKVSNCICLFGLHHTDAFPIDTHIKQLLDKYYDGHFDTDYFKGIAGIIQQYLFYYEIM